MHHPSSGQHPAGMTQPPQEAAAPVQEGGMQSSLPHGLGPAPDPQFQSNSEQDNSNRVNEEPDSKRQRLV